MCRKTALPSTNDSSSSSSRRRRSILGTIFNLLTFLYTLGFVSFRVTEIAILAYSYPAEVATSVLASLVLAKVTSSWSLMAILGMIAMVWITDDYLLEPIPSPKFATVVAITGANSGVGFETAKALAQFSSVIVIMGCRSVSKCQAAADQIRASQSNPGINVIPMQLDLNSFDSVHQFADSVKQIIGKPVDVLFNNAGYVPKEQESVNEYGLDPSFTSMHLSHHLLAELLVEQNPKLRLVSTSSGTHHFCSLPALLPDFLQFAVTSEPGCINEEYLSKNIYSGVNPDKYIVAKAANVMHASEFPLRHPKSTAIAIDLGWVGTSIQPWMSGQITPTSLGWMRSASIGIHPMLQAILQPSMDRDWAREGGVNIDVLGQLGEPFSFAWWTGEVRPEQMKEMGKKLWQTSSEILQKHGCEICQ